MASPSRLLEVRQISKKFPGVQALDQVSLRIEHGEVLALVGENGAGKSTLMKILAGVQPPDSGEMLLDGQSIRLAGVADALARGISLIHQELSLAENLSVTANLFLGREARVGGWLPFLDFRTARARARHQLHLVGLRCSPDSIVEDLAPGQRQLIEIARALSLDSRLLIMDEPTSSLTQAETDRLMDVIGDLRKRGVAVVYISHRLGEVERIADRAVVLRDGKNAGELSRAQINHASLVRLMVGRDLNQFFHRQHATESIDTTPRLEVRHLRFRGGPDAPISFTLPAGRITGMAGLVGAGRTELSEALFGIRRWLAGEVFIDGQAKHIQSPDEAIEAGLLLVPEDRRYHGLILQDTIRRNVALPNMDQLSRFGMLLFGREAGLANRLCSRLSVKMRSTTQLVGLLSGGNQQKVVLAKWLARKTRVLIFDEPTRGVDVGAKAEIYGLMDGLAKEGVAILMISSDLEEVLGMSDRVLVLHEGRLAGELSRTQLSEEAIMLLATGGGQHS